MTNNWEAVFQKLVPKVLQNWGWELITPDDMPAFIERVRRAVDQRNENPYSGQQLEDIIKGTTMRLYFQELYNVLGENGSLRQQRAYEEMGRYVTCIAYKFVRDQSVIKHCVQQVLIIIWEKWNQVRKPSSFIYYINTVVRNEIKGYWRIILKQQEKEIPGADAIVADEDVDEGAVDVLFDKMASAPPAEDTFIKLENQREFCYQVGRALSRSRQRQAVIIGHFFYGLGLVDLAEMLNTSINNIYVLKSKALASLRENEEFIKQFADVIGTSQEGKVEHPNG